MSPDAVLSGARLLWLVETYDVFGVCCNTSFGGSPATMHGDNGQASDEANC